MKAMEKYANVDLKKIDPFSVEDEEEARWLIFQLDQIIGKIEQDISHERSEKFSDRDGKWMADAGRALKSAKATRQAIQERKGYLTKLAKREFQERQDRVLLDELIGMVPRSTLMSAVGRARGRFPHLFEGVDLNLMLNQEGDA